MVYVCSVGDKDRQEQLTSPVVDFRSRMLSYEKNICFLNTKMNKPLLTDTILNFNIKLLSGFVWF